VFQPGRRAGRLEEPGTFSQAAQVLEEQAAALQLRVLPWMEVAASSGRATLINNTSPGGSLPRWRTLLRGDGGAQRVDEPHQLDGQREDER
jgi:hypothetical protein